MSYTSPRQVSELFLILEKIDMHLAQAAHEKPCEYCGGQLDVANYWRKIRGTGADKPVIRFGLCCRREGCRKRARVESMRFLGGFIYSSPFVLLVSALMNGDSYRFKNIARRFGLAPQTLKRWQHFWDDIFEKTSFWKEQRGKVLSFFHQTPSFKESFQIFVTIKTGIGACFYFDFLCH